MVVILLWSSKAVLMYLVLDTETTGLPKKRTDSEYTHVPRLVQISWILFDGEQVLQEKDFVVKPEGFYIPSFVSRIHGITNQYANLHGQKLEAILSELSEILNLDNLTLVGHNIAFDRLIIEAELWRKKLECYEAFLELKTICTMKKTAAFCKLPSKVSKNKFKMPNLQELHTTLFNEGFNNAHNSLFDARACLRCFTKLRELQVV